MTKLRLHHHGIVVKDLSAAITMHTDLLGATQIGPIYDDSVQQAQICFLETADRQVLIELIAPYSEQAPVANFLHQRGGGLHHICWMTPNLGEAMAGFHHNRALLVFGPKPAVAFAGRQIVFFYLRDRTLLELVEGDPDADPLTILAETGV